MTCVRKCMFSLSSFVISVSRLAIRFDCTWLMLQLVSQKVLSVCPEEDSHRMISLFCFKCLSVAIRSIVAKSPTMTTVVTNPPKQVVRELP